MTIFAAIDALTDQQAIRVLALLVDHQQPLPDATRLRDLDTAVHQAATDPDLQPYQQPHATQTTAGDLARATLTHLATTQPDLIPVIDRAAAMAQDTTRFEPATLAIGALVVLALQTDVMLSRDAAGRWRFRLHKKPMNDSTLGRLLGKLLNAYT